MYHVYDDIELPLYDLKKNLIFTNSKGILMIFIISLGLLIIYV